MDGKCAKLDLTTHEREWRNPVSGLIFPSWWNIRQKVAIATLCTLWGRYIPPISTLCTLWYGSLFILYVRGTYVCLYLGKGQTKLFIFLKCKLIASKKRIVYLEPFYRSCTQYSYRKGKRYIFTAGLRHYVVEMHIFPGSFYTYLEKGKRYQRHVFLYRMANK